MNTESIILFGVPIIERSHIKMFRNDPKTMSRKNKHAKRDPKKNGFRNYELKTANVH